MLLDKLKQTRQARRIFFDWLDSRGKLNYLFNEICKPTNLKLLTDRTADWVRRQFGPASKVVHLRGTGMSSKDSNTNQIGASTSQGESNETGTPNEVAGKPKFRATKEELKARLSPIQYRVTQLKSTERPNSGEYNKLNKKGTYHCVVCDEELFKSDTKFDSGCGWPAFFGAADERRLKFVADYALVSSSNLLLLAKSANLVRTEVLCANCDAHLGHRFDDGPKSKGGKRYCINSAAMRFEPAEDK